MSVKVAPEPLKISIVGAGLGGLAAAIALRRQGHQVQIFERAPMMRQLGAGIGIPPNGARVLEGFSHHYDRLRSIDVEGWTLLSSNGDLIKNIEFGDFRKSYGQPWTLCHRVDLHDELTRLALDDEGPGYPARLKLASAVQSCNSETGTLTLKDGTTLEADVVIGADGINSTIRTSILGYVLEVPPSGQCTFRWLLDASKVRHTEKINWVHKEGLHHFKTVISQSSKIIIYPIRDGTLITVAATCPDTRDQTKARPNTMVARTVLQEAFKDHHANFTALLDIADDEVSLYQVRALPPLPTWTSGVACLLGDAAHAMHPTLGQGAAIGFENAATLGALLPLGTKKAQVPTRLRAYQQLCKGRAEQVAEQSAPEPDLNSFPAYSQKPNPADVQRSIFEYNATEVAQKYYNEHFLEDANMNPSSLTGI